ncbi:MAG: glycosyltransferase [Pseudomonadota bacterium]
MLAVATQDPTTVAETYVRQHMRLVFPDETLGIALGGTDPGIGVPFHIVEPRRGGILGKALAARTWARTGYAIALTWPQEQHLQEVLQKANVTAVLAEFGTTGCALRSFCKRLGLPLIVNFHGYDATVLPKRRDMRHAYYLLARDAAKVVCGSRHFATILVRIGFPASKVEVVPCGIEVSDFMADTQKDPNLIAAVGRLTEKKRPDLMLRAFAQAADVCPDLRLEVIGDGPRRSVCNDLVRDLGIEDRVVLHGARTHSEVCALLSRASVLVQHSATARNGDQESQGISLLEAMASGMAVVATDHNGFSETVVHGVTGLLSPEKDVAAMAGNIIELTQDHTRTRTMGAAGRSRVIERFDAATLSAQLRQVILSALSGTTESGPGLAPDWTGAT